MSKRVLISVYDKTGVVEFAKKLVDDFHFEIVSTGSTANCLREAGLSVTEVSDVTGVQEMLDGKVKTLHPSIFGGILANINITSEKEEIDKLNITPFNMVVVNLYPFKQTAQKTIEETELIKNIDIGGVALLRAAAKNNLNVLAVSSPSQYSKVLENLAEHNGLFTKDFSQKLAVEVYANTAIYDECISKTLSKSYDVDADVFSLILENPETLRYGENPHQMAKLYKTDKALDYDLIQGKELSYNNILDITSALAITSEFFDVPCCSIIKHNTPCGVALGKDSLNAYERALDCDPISAFGGVLAFSTIVDEKLAKQLTSMFLEVVIAPEFTSEALEQFKVKKNLRVIKLNTPLKNYTEFLNTEVKVTPFGVLIQEPDVKQLDKDLFKTVTKEKPTAELVEDLIFAWKIVKHVKSNAIVVAKDFKTLGICGGQTSRIDALEIALNRACDSSKDAVLASDGFFPAIDNIHSSAQGRIKAIIQPGGSIKDADVIATADKYGIAMVTTGIRHFKH